MLQIRAIHKQGAVRVAVDGDHVLTGGADGVVALLPVKRWPDSPPLWARECHAGSVTHVLLHDALHLAFSCGRDGQVVLHENIHAPAAAAAAAAASESVADAPTSRVICRVSGELRCLHFDAAQKVLFVGGDSLRCLHMAGSRFEVRTVPLIVPEPIVAVAPSPCGRFLAMASASGDVGVVSATPLAGAEGDSAREAATDVRVKLPKALSATVSRDDACAYRLQWCRTDGGLFLFIPAISQVSVYRLTPAQHAEAVAAAPAAAGVRLVGGLPAEGLHDFFGVHAYAVSAHRICCVLVARYGLFVGKLDDRSLALTRHAAQRYDATEHGGVTAVEVDGASGDIVVGLSSGSVSLLRRVALKALDEAKAAQQKLRQAEAKQQQQQQPAVTLIGADTQDIDSAERTDEEQQREAKQRTAKRQSGPPGERRQKSTGARNGDDDDWINDDSDDGEGSSASGSGSSSSSSSSGDSGKDSDVDDDGNLTVREDLAKVVVDLKAANADYIEGEDSGRPSRWRRDDPQSALAYAEREARRHATATRFLDDEAEEASAGDAESEEEAAAEDDGYGERRRVHSHSDNDEEENEDGDGSEHDGSAVATGGAGAMDGGDSRAAHAPGCLDYSFQVGATPVGEADSCYLAYNTTGFICCGRDGATVHFHDVSIPAVRINEKGTILMGTLSPVGAGFVVAPEAASAHADGAVGDSIDDEVPRLTVFFRTFVALGAQSDWRAQLLPGETVRCMSAGLRFLAVATSRYLRIYSESGLEVAVLSKHPRIVAMAGTTSRRLMGSFKNGFDPLALVYLEGGEHRLEVLDVASRTTQVAAQTIPLTELPDGSTHQLQWLGWSEDGPIHTADTAGVVRMHTQTWGGSWVPVFDPRALTDQSYNLWIWAVSDESLCAYRSLKSDSPYPAAVAGGLPLERPPLFLPLSRTALAAREKDAVAWDRLLRREVRTDELKRQAAFYSETIASRDALHDAKLLALFQSAVREHLTTRAYDLATMMELRDNLEDCTKDANKNGQRQLVEKLLALYQQRVRSKSRRKCTLPLESAVVGERERDALLRRLLAQAGAAESGTAQVPPRGPAAASAEPAAKAAASAAAVPSPAKSEASTAVTATTERSDQSGRASTAAVSASSTRRRVTFLEPPAAGATPAAPPRAPAAEAAPAPTVPAKAANPFAARRGPAAAAAPPPPPAVAKERQQSTLQPPRQSARAELSRCDSQSTASSQRGPQPAATAAAATTTTPERQLSPLAERAAEREGAQRSRSSEERDRSASSPSGGRPTGTTPSSERDTTLATSSSAGDRATVPRQPAFVPCARPTTARAPSPPLPGAAARAAPFDPFLPENIGGYDSAHTSVAPVNALAAADGDPEVTVEALLSASHGKEPQSDFPRSASFGEALRKRYREDVDEDDEENEERNGGARIAVPSAPFPSVQTAGD